MMKGSFDILGNIAIVKFQKRAKPGEKRIFAKKLLGENKSVRTVLEKVGKFKGRLRKMQTKFVAGEKTKEALYRESGCIFRFNVDETYFSPRLSNERKEIADKIRKGDNVLVMFAGVAPYSIVIAKNSKAEAVYSNEINRKANDYGKLNIELNKVKDRVIMLNGDIKKIASKIKKRFDVIVMPRPQLKDSFLGETFKLSKKGTKVYYYDFCKTDEINSVKEKVLKEAGKAGKKIKILNIKKAGEIAPYKYRIRIDFAVL
ncbi:MAG: hypothetical protein PHH00_03000 [Candidatus Nanoarchaeia archaeon]|nr:hypothetical protein [Candidatus Nanoarchaeia archaeon]